MPKHLLTYCPSCGNKSFQTGSFKPWTCSSCDFIFYQNTAAAAGALIFDQSERLLLIERALEPSKGKLGLPGGFIDAGETIEQGLKREIQEEVQLNIQSLKYLCSFPNKYLFNDLTYNTVDLFFTARLTNGQIPKQGNEVSGIQWIKPADIDNDRLAFPSFKQAIAYFQIQKNRSHQ